MDLCWGCIEEEVANIRLVSLIEVVHVRNSGAVFSEVLDPTEGGSKIPVQSKFSHFMV